MKKSLSNLEIPTTESGYFDCWSMIEKNKKDYDLFIIIGGRRLGKTYSLLRGLIENRVQHMYVRRTDSDLEECLTVKKNPYRVINKDFDKDIRIVSKGKETQIAVYEEDEIKEYLGIASSVSTSGSVRGAFLEDIDYLLYDEFINLKPVNTLKKKEGTLFFDLYDTANNDRDIRGAEPLKAVLLSNANSVDDGVLRVLKLGHIIYEMIMNNQSYYGDKDRRIYMALLPSDNVITNKRKKSAIGRLTEGTSYGDMAMNNEFVGSYFGDIKEKINYAEYYPLCSYNNIYFYAHKSDGHIYASYRKAKCPSYVTHTLKKFKRDYGMRIGMQFEGGRMRYRNYNVKLDVINLI